MKIFIAVDANIILSALLGGKSAVLLFDSRFAFITTRFTTNEVERYLPKLAGKLRVRQEKLADLLYTLPITIYEARDYTDSLDYAKQLIGSIDPKDVDILALALHFGTYLWSQDKNFEQAGYQKLLKTYQFIE